MIQIQEDRVRWLVVADSVVLFIFDDDTFELAVPMQSHDTKILLKWKQLADQKVLNIRERLNDDLIRLRKSSLSPQGVLNGNEVSEQRFKVGERPLSGIQHILLFTDGLFPPSEDPEQSPDFAYVVELFKQGGLEKVQRHYTLR